MGFKTGLIVGAGVGYVLGAKAGRDRYEQILDQVERLTANPTARDLATRARNLADQSRTLISDAKGAKAPENGS